MLSNSGSYKLAQPKKSRPWTGNIVNRKKTLEPKESIQIESREQIKAGDPVFKIYHSSCTQSR